jgi:hypothetical protein
VAKNNWDNRKLLATHIVKEYTMEQLIDIAVSVRMEHYLERDDSFQEDWHGTAIDSSE